MSRASGRANGKAVLVAGATGYLGGRLTPLLLDAGYAVRAVGRAGDKIRDRPWGRHPRLEPLETDLRDPEMVRRAAKGCFAAFHLAHSMARPPARQLDAAEKIASNLARAAEAEGFERMVYAGPLGAASPGRLPPYLEAGRLTARILGQCGVPATVLNCSLILGSGSAAFEIVRRITDLLPVIAMPAWMDVEVEPVSVRNVLVYLLDCLEKPEAEGGTFEACGPERLTWEGLFALYAEMAGLKRRIIEIPLFPSRAASYLMGLATPLSGAMVANFTAGLRHPLVCRNPSIREISRQVLLTCEQALNTALGRTVRGTVDTCCHDAGTCRVPEWAVKGDRPYTGGASKHDAYRAVFAAEPENIWRVVSGVGGETGWYYGNLLWKVRGLMDKLAGGVGLARGRPGHEGLRVGDALDFWRVAVSSPPARLVLLAEMRLSGQALLEFALRPAGEGRTEMTVTAHFLPRGWSGLAYWWAVSPFHSSVFKGMLRAMAEAAGTTLSSGPTRLRGG